MDSCVSQKQVTFTPRLLTADLKGGIGSICEQGILYDEEATSLESSERLWDSEKLEITSTRVPDASSTKTLTEDEGSTCDDAKSWADYLLPSFHPRSLTVIKEYSHNCTSQPFDIFTYGRNLWATEQFSDDFSDRIRSYVEECDLMQGFQVCV